MAARSVGCPRVADSRAAPTDGGAERADRLRRFLLAYWLRPENAFWMTLRSVALDRCVLERPSVDIGCGDGVFSFLHAGGVLGEEFDVFLGTGRLERAHGERTDIFDCIPADYAPVVVRRPASVMDVGLDLKAALLAKAQRLEFYRRHVLHDGNRPLPLPDGAFCTVYCNAAYWVREIDRFLSELRRITRPGGRVVLQVKLSAIRDYTLEPFRDKLGARFLEIIGRGRLECWPTLASRREWEARFARAGLRVLDTAELATRTHAHLWDVGLRPIAPLLVRMANGLSTENRLAIKRDWVALMEELLRPICRADFELAGGSAEAAEVQYVLGVC